MIINMPCEVKYILKKLSQSGFEGFVVGGCVRDSLIGREVVDWDITTNAVPDDIIRIFPEEKKLQNGIKHGTVTIIINNIPFEITTFRIDGDYKDFRRPETVRFSRQLDEDLRRRDFTINSMAYNESSGLIDIFGGRDDIERKIIRCVGDAEERFQEDTLRILRAIRFSAQLGFNLHHKTENAIKNNAHLISKISRERIRDEIVKIISSDKPEKIGSVIDYGLMNYIIPSNVLTNGVKENLMYNSKDILTDAVLYMRNNLGCMLAAMLHGMLMHHIDKASNSQCCGGETLSVVSEIILKSLRFDNKTINKTMILIHNHDSRLPEDQKSIRLWLNRVGADNFKDLIKLKRYLKKSLKSGCVPESDADIERTDQNLFCILKNGDCFEKSKLALNGDDIKKWGFSNGREIGKIIDMLLMAVIEDPSMNTRENLVNYLSKINIQEVKSS